MFRAALVSVMVWACQPAPVVEADTGGGFGSLLPVFEMDIQGRTAHFTWTSVPGATSHRLLEHADDGGFVERAALGPDALQTDLPWSWIQDWGRIFVMETCRGDQCQRSPAVTGADVDVAAGVEVLEATMPTPGFMGENLAMSADGTTIAAAAATGGDQPTKDLFDAGEVVVFRYAEDGWAQQAVLRAPDPTSFAGFGRSVAMSDDGDVVVVGEAFVAGPSNSYGRLHIFRRASNTWALETTVEPLPGTQVGDQVTLSGSGQTVAFVSAAQEYGTPTTIVVLDHTSAGWSSPESSASLQVAYPTRLTLDFAGTTLAVAAYGEGIRLFERGVSGPWVDAAVLEPDLLQGSWDPCLSAAGDVLAVGAEHERLSVNRTGAVYIYERAGGAWTESARVEPPSADASPTTGKWTHSGFGSRIALSQDGLHVGVAAPFSRARGPAIGWPSADPPHTHGVGTAWVFSREGDDWVPLVSVRSPRAEAGDRFASSLDLSADGRVLAVGTPLEVNAKAQPQDRTSIDGAVFVY